MDELEKKINAQKFLIAAQRAVIGKLETKLEHIQPVFSKLLALIHEDIFEKTPRGQVKEGDKVNWVRCKELLAMRDEIQALQPEAK